MDEKYNSEHGIQQERENLAISFSEMEALLGIIRRCDSFHPFVTMPSEKDIELLKRRYGTNISMHNIQTMYNSRGSLSSQIPVAISQRYADQC